ncbi:protein NUCLEAR FUSION DEFECTIVE 4-like [Melia azedarach]|uniref:Protein NUCLEAR FUSION DEFECTIVE 4-like n=1 Tax=Melia azedarach TaxID=155640 RepID=A0ACC1XLA5_MELAZ|nr:protein NUCLEAR FUSION DEFECTIVE 4-like [Melia azedarach]
MEERRGTKWMATVASIWIQCCTGATYTFSIYSSTLKSTQDYDQSTLETVSVFKDIGGSAGVLSGLLFSFVTLNHHNRLRFLRGPWVVHLTGAILWFAGYFLIWASVAGLIRRPPVPLMCLFIFTAAQAQAFFNTGNIVTGVMNFGNYSGTIVGILKGFLGLSGAVLISVYDTICKGNPSAYLLILALLPSIVSLLLMCQVRIYGTNSVDDKKHLNAFSAIAVILAAYFMVITILENIFSFSLLARIIIFIVLLLLLASPLRIAIMAEREHAERLSQTFSSERNQVVDCSDTMAYDELLDGEYKQKAALDDKLLKDGGDMNLIQAMGTGNFWLLCIAMVCGMGSGMATMNNIGQVGESLGYTTTEINTLVSMWSIWNFFGRFGAGYVSDILLHRMGWARPLFIVITLAAMSIGHIVIASGFPGNLYLGTIIVGVCYGSQWSLMLTITSEIFGVGHMGTIFNTISIASPVGSYICSVRIIGYIYDKLASGEDHSCYGTHCFMLSFLIMAAVALLGSLVAFLFFFRTKRFYNQVVLRRLLRRFPRT